MAEAPAAWEVSVRKALPKDEHIVFAVMGFWAGMVCFGKMVGAAMSSGKSAPTPVAAPAAASSSGAELTEDNCDTFFNDEARVAEWAKNLK